jgi:hypothetical protein
VRPLASYSDCVQVVQVILLGKNVDCALEAREMELDSCSHSRLLVQEKVLSSHSTVDV